MVEPQGSVGPLPTSFPRPPDYLLHMAILRPLPPVKGHQDDLSVSTNGQRQKSRPQTTHESDCYKLGTLVIWSLATQEDFYTGLECHVSPSHISAKWTPIRPEVGAAVSVSIATISVDARIQPKAAEYLYTKTAMT